jgi:hypothetical protein
MDLEKLTKHQIVLLTLLVSFVTSIATGIVAVSLMDQAPPAVSRTINQIVERTVQTVVPATQGAATITEKTVVVKDDDLAAQSISSVQKSIIRIVAKGGDELIARGIITDSKGTAVSDQAALDASGATEFEAILYSGERVPASLRKQTGTTTPIAVLDVSVGTSTGFAPSPIADPSKIKLGQSVIRIGGTGHDIVGSGIIAAVPPGSSNVEATVTSSTPGSVITTLFGEIIGMTTSDSLAMGNDFYTIITAAPTSLPPVPATKSAS